MENIVTLRVTTRVLHALKDKNQIQIRMVVKDVEVESIVTHQVTIFAKCVLQDSSPLKIKMNVLDAMLVYIVIHLEESCALPVSQ
jgi:hypothetical protein